MHGLYGQAGSHNISDGVFDKTNICFLLLFFLCVLFMTCSRL